MDPTGNNSPYSPTEQEFLQKLNSPIDQWVLQHQLDQGLSLLHSVQDSVSAPLLRDEASIHDYLRTYSLALFIELGEFINELAWKPWKPGKKVDIAKVQDEFADILAFLGVILVLLIRLHPEITTNTLATAYITKSRINVARFTGKVEDYSVVGEPWTKA